MNEQQNIAPKKKFPVKTVVLVLALALFFTFAFKNWTPVTIWPIGNSNVFMVIVISMVLGLLVGVLLHSLYISRPRFGHEEKVVERN